MVALASGAELVVCAEALPASATATARVSNRYFLEFIFVDCVAEVWQPLANRTSPILGTLKGEGINIQAGLAAMRRTGMFARLKLTERESICRLRVPLGSRVA